MLHRYVYAFPANVVPRNVNSNNVVWGERYKQWEEKRQEESVFEFGNKIGDPGKA
jgi:hypothetical protein